MSTRRLQLERPLVAFDLETTGLDVERDRIVELSFVKLLPDGGRETRTRRIHPTIPIPAEATAVHGIGDADVADCPKFAQVANSLHGWLADCDLAGFNIEKFDLRLLAAEFKRVQLEFPLAGTRFIDAFRIYAQREPRDLSAAVRYYCGRELVGAHGAEADTLATVDVLLAQLERYPDLPLDVQGLHDVCHPRDPRWVDDTGKLQWRPDGEVVVTFGKHRGRTLRELVAAEADYLRWMLGGDFPLQVKEILGAALRGQHPQQPGPTAATP